MEVAGDVSSPAAATQLVSIAFSVRTSAGRALLATLVWNLDVRSSQLAKGELRMPLG